MNTLFNKNNFKGVIYRIIQENMVDVKTQSEYHFLNNFMKSKVFSYEYFSSSTVTYSSKRLVF